uniref:BED-type domain-containing protein n=1 Tax=Heliothis virescens TaxID=7102 RepID=A0A2A4JMZ5_HELVI
MQFLQTETDLSSSDSDGEQEKSFAKKRKPTWNYYEVLDSDKFEATCKLCSAGVNYDSVSDLVKHIREEHGEEPLDSDDDYEPKVQATKPRRMVSKTWNYYKIVDPQAKVATCLLCRKKFSYSATVSNLKRHLYRKHGEIVRSAEGDDGNKLIISSNGQLFEVATESSKILDDDKEPLEMDTIYLEDLDESLDQIPPRRISTSSPKKKTTVPLKRNFSSIAKEQVNRNTCSETEQPTQRHSTENMATLDYFGQYIVALLKELPKAVSDQLQHEIIKQILTSKMALESPAPNYKITISENSIRNEYTNTREPVTVTVNEPIQSEITEVVINDGTAELPTLNEE